MVDTVSPLTLQMLMASGGLGAPQDPAIAASVPRLQLAQSMIQSGMSDAPTSKWGALGRLGQTIAGNLIYGKANEGMQDILQQRAKQAGDASNWIMGGPSTPAGTPAGTSLAPPPTPVSASPGTPQLQTFATQLASSESPSPSKVNDQGFSGQFQFGAGRLADTGLYTPAPGENLKANEWKGTFNIPGFPDVKTQKDFLANPAAQNAALGHDLQNTDKAIANTPGAGALDQNGLRAVAHLGGIEGMRKFVESNGKYDPADANGTHLSDYYHKFSGGGAAPGAPSVSSPAPGVAPAGPNPWEVIRRAGAVLTNPAFQYNQQALTAAQHAIDVAKLQIQTGSWSAGANGVQTNAYTGEQKGAAAPREQFIVGPGGVQTNANTGEQKSAAAPLPDYKPDPNNPGVMTSYGQKPVFAPSPRITVTPAGKTVAVGPGGVQQEIAPADNPGVAARSSANTQGAETGKAAAVLPSHLVKLGTEADTAIGNIDYGLNQLHQAAAGGINAGYFAPWLATAAAAGKSLGVNLQSMGIDPNAVGNVQSAQKTLGVVAGSILQNTIGKDSAITDAKIEHFIHTQPGIETDPHAIDRVLNWARSQFVFNRGMAMDAMQSIDPQTGMLAPGWQAQFYKKSGAFAPIYDPLHQEMEQPAGRGPAEHAPPMPAQQQTQKAPQAPAFSRAEIEAEIRRRAGQK